MLKHLFKAMSQQKQDYFQNKALLGNRMDVLWARDLAEGLLDFLPDMLFQICPVGLSGPVAVVFAPNAQIDPLALIVVVLIVVVLIVVVLIVVVLIVVVLIVVVFLLVVGVGTVAEQVAAAGQIDPDRLQGRHMGKSPWVNQILHWLTGSGGITGSGGNKLDAEAVEKSPLTGAPAPMLLASDQPTTVDADIVTHRDRQRVDHIGFVHIQFVEKIGQILQQRFQRVGQLACRPVSVSAS